MEIKYGGFCSRKSFNIPKGIIRTRKSKDRRYNGQKKKYKGQTIIYKTLHRKLKTEQHEPTKLGGHLRYIPLFLSKIVDRYLSFLFRPLCCLFLFDLRILITSLVSSNSSYTRLPFRYGLLMTVL